MRERNADSSQVPQGESCCSSTASARGDGEGDGCSAPGHQPVLTRLHSSQPCPPSRRWDHMPCPGCPHGGGLRDGLHSLPLADTVGCLPVPRAWRPAAFQPTSPQLPLTSRQEGTWQGLGWRPSMCHVDTLQVSWGKTQLSRTAPMWGQRGRVFGPHPCSSGRSWRGQVPGRDLGGISPGSPRLARTFSLETWWENGQVPSVFLHVPRTNLCTWRRGFEGRAAEMGEGSVHRHQSLRPCRAVTWYTRPPSRGRGCRGTARRGCTCRNGCSTCSIPAPSCAASAWPVGRWPDCAAGPGCGHTDT